jgi:hypothetical protein
MNADVAATAAHKSARTTVAKSMSAVVAYNVVTAQGLMTFAFVETRRSKVPVRAVNKARGQVPRGGLGPCQPCTATAAERSLAHQQPARYHGTRCMHCVWMSPRQIPRDGATTCGRRGPPCTQLSVDQRRRFLACFADTPVE